MRMRLMMSAAAALAMLPVGCTMPGRPKPGPEVPRPDAIMDFDTLYGQNCAGCHGANGHDGAATDLANPEYEALVDDATLRDVIANGEKDSLMPGFGLKAGGTLTDAQVNVLVAGMRSRWGKANALQTAGAPPYKDTHPGNAARGQQVYTQACARCHGQDNAHPGAAGSVLNGSFLSLINEQTIRTTIIAGRPDVGQPDWRGDVPGHALSDAEVADVSAWMIAQRPGAPGQPYPRASAAAEPPAEAQPMAVKH